MQIYDFKVKDIDGKEVAMETYQDQVLLIVNVASKCGFTPQYEGLEKLYQTYQDRGFAVLGFPCNQFMKQEPEDEEAIKTFCSLTYDVTFPMFAKISVNGTQTAPLYKFIKSEAGGLLKKIPWNFTKFLVDKKGNVIQRYAPTVEPSAIATDIEALL